MRFIAVLFLSIFSTLFLNSFAQNKTDEITGTWLTESQKAKVTIFKSGNYFYGKIVWLKEPNGADGKQKIDKNNPDKKLKSRPILGLLMLTGFEFDAKNNQWINGDIYDPKNGKTYSCKITQTENNALEIRGFIGISLIGRTEVWTRSE